MTNKDVFHRTAPYYDAVYSHRNTMRESAIITKLVRSLTPKAKSLLDIGCGTGAHVLGFWKNGFVTTGLDQSAHMLAIAKNKTQKAGADISFIHSNALSYRSPATYDVITSLFDVLSYMTTNTQVEDFFSTLSSLITPRGIVVFDCWYGPGVLSSKPKTMLQQYTKDSLFIQRKKSPHIMHETNTVSVLHKLRISSRGAKPIYIQESHTMRYFFYPEIEHYAAKAGLSILMWGKLGIPMRPATISMWSVCFIAQKKSTGKPRQT